MLTNNLFMEGEMKQKLGTSYLIAVVVMTLVAISLSVLLYAYFSGWIGSREGTLSRPIGLLQVEKAFYNQTDNAFYVEVRNDGSGPVRITHAYVIEPDGTTTRINLTSNNYRVSPGEVILVKVPYNVIIGSIYTIKIVADDGSVVTTNVIV
jgi:hypothetical protein